MKYNAREINGIVLVNKPQGLSSNAVLQRVKHLFRAKKAGHTGSLDPLATGMLPVCFGEATKYSQYLLDADKCYETTGLFGITTDTGDAMGEIIARASSSRLFSVDDIESVLNTLRGPLEQTPPMYSALKHQGKPLYEYARRGVTLPRAPRQVMIHQLSLDAYSDNLFRLTVRCSKGTYIRSLVESIGEALGVGAHVTQLHRVYTAGFEGERMFTLDELVQLSEQLEPEALLSQTILPTERAVMHLPSLSINAAILTALRHGKVISPEDYAHSSQQAQQLVRLHDEHARFVGLAEIQNDGTLVSKRLLTF